MRRKVLILDRSYQVIDIMPFKKALGKWGRSLVDSKYDVQVVSTYDDIVMNINGNETNPPSILRFNYLQNLKANKHTFQSFGRRNIWHRDNRECQYCGTQLTLNQMHWDHVTPKSKGGKTNWTNIVCCCKSCNDRKADKTLNESGMKLRNKPFVPLSYKTIYQVRLDRLRGQLTDVPDENWLMFCKHILDESVAEKMELKYAKNAN